MIYVDSSVVLSFLLAEDRHPDRRKLTRSHSEATTAILGTVQFMEMVPLVLDRAREPFPHPVRAPDALHLSSALYLHERGQSMQIATYDAEFAACARAVGVDLFPL